MLLLFWAALAAAEPSVEAIAQGAFRLRLDGAPGVIGAAQARLTPAARRACADKAVIFGRFRYLTSPAAERTSPVLEQELLCLAGSPAPIAAALQVRPEWAPEAILQARLLAASYDYFSAKDAGRHAQAYRWLAPRQQADRSVADWSRAALDFNAEAGPVRGRRVVEVSWYNHPADAPEPGIYVAADYSAEFEKLEFVCGYLMWRLEPDGSFRLVREEQNLVHKRDRAMAPIDRDPLRARMGCKD